jgi:hypothetical protein
MLTSPFAPLVLCPTCNVISPVSPVKDEPVVKDNEPLSATAEPELITISPVAIQLSAVDRETLPLPAVPAPLDKDKTPPSPIVPLPAFSDNVDPEELAPDSIAISPPFMDSAPRPEQLRPVATVTPPPSSPLDAPLVIVTSPAPAVLEPEARETDPDDGPSAEHKHTHPLELDELEPERREISPPSLTSPAPAAILTLPPVLAFHADIWTAPPISKAQPPRMQMFAPLLAHELPEQMLVWPAFSLIPSPL